MNFDQTCISETLEQLGLTVGSNVFLHADLGKFGLPEGAVCRDSLCEIYYNAIIDILGSTGNLVVPAFTYSLPRREVFDIEAPSLNCGIFSDWLIRNGYGKRSWDPNISVVCVGEDADVLAAHTPVITYGPGSIFEELLERNFHSLNFNRNAASTFVHFAEKKLRVDYRFEKFFSGSMIQNSQLKPVNRFLWVSRQNEKYQANFSKFSELAYELGLCVSKELGYGKIEIMTMMDQFKIVEFGLKQDPYFLTNGFFRV